MGAPTGFGDDFYIIKLSQSVVSFLDYRVSQNKKVPSFGATNRSQNEPELNDDASSPASAATNTEESQAGDENQTDTTSDTDDTPDDMEDTFLRLISNIGRGDQTDEMSDELENQEMKEDEGDEDVSQDEILVENVMEENPSYQVRSCLKNATYM